MAGGCTRSIVIGIGNPERGDDGAGRSVARQLRGTVETAEHEGEATALLSLLDGADTAFLVDACALGAPAGSIHRFDLAEGRLPRTAGPLSSHGLGLAEGLELARALGQLPPRCIVYAIEGQSFETGAPLSAPVAKAVAALVRRLRLELAAERAAQGEAGCTKPR
jgi:hydrogenase maturation protease